MAKSNKGRKFFATTATAALVASAIVPAVSAAQINDINSVSSYAQEAVQNLVDRGVITGDTKGNFNPRSTVTRAEAATVLAKALDLKVAGSISFSDVKNGAWYYDAISKVVSNGIFQGQGAGKFNPSGNLTRSEAAIIFVDAFDLEGKGDLSAFSDKGQVKAWAEDALSIAVANGVVKGDSGKLNPNSPITKQDFAVMYERAEAAQVTEEVTTGSVKAINTTTVEVTFENAVTDLNELNFAIEGLQITNKAVKQTNAKTVVLTTSAQTADVEYTVTVNGEAIGKFKGASAVVPTKIDVTTTSLQGVIGKEVTLKAQVEVPAGQSKAGIPVTFNIVSDNTNLNSKIEVEALTDDKGVATYTYTRYYSHNDHVAAYATSKSSVVSNGKVYWADKTQLAVSEITAGNELANETKKSYKVAGKANTTYYIAVKENLNVTPDKITDVKVQNHGTQNFVTPYELTTGADQFASVTTNSNGEGAFTVYGTNLSATPIVYLPSSVNTSATDYSFSKLALQSEAPTVKFAQVDRLAIAVVGEGTADSAEYFGTVAPVKADANSAGGRTYTVTVTDKAGKVAPAGTVAHVKFEDMAGDVYFSTANANFVKLAKNDLKTLTVGKDGKVQFRVVGKGAASYVKPTVFLNTTGTVSPVVLDKTDVQAVAEVTYFKTPVVTNAALKVTDINGNVITSILANQDAYFTYQSVDQNGFAYRPGNYTVTPGSTTTIYVQQVDPVTGVVTFVPQSVTNNPITANTYVLAFDVTSTFGQAVVKDANGIVLPAVQNMGSAKTYHVNSNAEGKAVVRITSQSVDTVSVNVTGASNVLPTQTASVNFTASNVLPDVHTGIVTALTSSTIKIDAFNAVSLTGAKFFNQTNNPINQAEFTTLVNDVATGKNARVSTVKQADGTYAITFIGTVDKTSEELLANALKSLEVVEVRLAGLVEADYTTASWAAYSAAKTTAVALPQTTTAEVTAKINALTAAEALLVNKASNDAALAAAKATLATAKAKAEAKVQADYTTASWTVFVGKIGAGGTVTAMSEGTVNQVNAKAAAYDAAVAALVAKAGVGAITASVTATNAATGTLVLTFTEANSLAGFDIDLYDTVSGAAAGTLATVADTSTAVGTLTVTVNPTGTYDLATNTGATYEFKATAIGTEAIAKDIKVTVKYVSGAWTATVTNL